MFRRLFEPVRLGRATAKNRVMQVATSNLLADQGTLGDRAIAFYEERAKGGVGSVVTEALAVHPSSRARLRAYDPDVIPGLARLGEMMRRYGVVVFAQLNHSGRQHHAATIPTVWGPSALACPHSGGVPHEMDVDEIESVIAGFIQAAVNAREAGLDGVEVHGAQGHLIQEFMSAFSNQRTDEYGGSLKNRLRFALEIVDGIRRACGDNFVVGFRLGAEELSPGGITIDEACQAAKLLDATGQIDYLSISQGNFNTIEIHTPDRFYPMLGFIEYPERIKAVVPRLPIVACGRIITPEVAEQVLASSQADVIGLCRPLLADAAWARKAAEGRTHELRKCISCNQCWGWITAEKPVGCVHNAVTGRELEWGAGTLTRASKSKRVVVVGGGPAGLEAAAIAAERGHTVTLFEWHDRLGGAARLASSIPGHEEIGYVAEYQIGALERASVDVRLGTQATAELVLAERPDAVVVATGSLSRRDRLGAPVDFPVYSVYDVVGARRPTGRRAVLFDEDGYYLATEVAELIARNDTKVFVVTRFWEVGREIPAVSRATTVRALDRLGAELISSAWFSRVDGRDVVLAHYYTGREWTIPDVDCLVHVGASVAQNRLYRELKGGVPELHCIGDAFMARRIADAVLEGHRVGRDL